MYAMISSTDTCCHTSNFSSPIHCSANRLVWSTIHWSMVVVKMRRKVCRGLRGIGSVGPKWLVNGRTVTGLRLVDHSRESILQTSTHFLNNYVCGYLCVIVLHVTVNVYCYCCGVCMYMLHVHLCRCVLVSCGQRVYLAMRDCVCVLFFVYKCVSVCIFVVLEWYRYMHCICGWIHGSWS